MPNQIVLAWVIDAANTTFGPTDAATALGAIKLYETPDADPVLGQNFGLTVASDVSAPTVGTLAKRTLTLNMNAANTPAAPPSFPCHPITSTPPDVPYPLRTTKTLPGFFFVANGSMSVQTSASQIPSLAIGDDVQFMSQQGVFYEVASVGATTIGLTAPYTGKSDNTTAFKLVLAPVTRAAIYSSSELDTAGVSTVPAIPAGSGARTVTIRYKDSTGAAFTTTATLTGKRPAAIPLAGGSVDIAEIGLITIASVGGFGNSVGEITMVELTSDLPAIPANATPFDFRRLTDEAQLLIGNALAYLPPSYFALAQQGASAPQLQGEFDLTTGSVNVPTSVDQTGALAAGNIIRFADDFRDNVQLPVDIDYVVQAVTPKLVTLTKPYRGIDTVGIGPNNNFPNNVGTRGLVGKTVTNKPSGATLVSPAPSAPPTNAQLAAPLAQFVALETAGPPPFPPGNPSTVPVPTFLSGLFTRTLQLALAGVPITPQVITFI